MDLGKILLVVIGGFAFIIVIFVVWFIATHNSINASDQEANAAWSNVENQYQRRADLFPNLVATVKAYATHESSVITDATNARAQWAGAKTPEEKVKAAEQMDATINRFMVVVEAYPDLKASSNFATLQAQIEGTENRISTERKRYTDAATAYNIKIKNMPTSIVADFYGYKAKPLFEANKGTDVAPKINFTE